jgi:hypothetical protein
MDQPMKPPVFKTPARLIVVLSACSAIAACAGNPMAGTMIRQVTILPVDQSCKLVGSIEGRSYLGAGFVGANTDHYNARRDALDTAPKDLLARSTHIVWGPTSSFGVDIARGDLFACRAA